MIIREIIVPLLVIVQNRKITKKIVYIYEACPYVYGVFLNKVLRKVRDSRFSQRFLLETKIFWDMTSCLVLVTDVSKEPSTFILGVKKMRWAA